MPSDLISIPPLKVDTNDGLFAARIMEYLHNRKRDLLKVIFCAEAKAQTQRILQLACQHETIHLPSPEAYPYYARRDSQRCNINHALQVPCEDVCRMLCWVEDHGIKTLASCIDLQGGTRLFEKLAAVDFKGFLVLTM